MFPNSVAPGVNYASLITFTWTRDVAIQKTPFDRLHCILTCTLIGSVTFPEILICSVAFSEPEYQTFAPGTRNSLIPTPTIIPPLRMNLPF